MDTLENIISQEVVHKLGWTLLHSLWQGGVVVLLLVVLLRVLRKSSANIRYLIACIGLVVIVLLPVVTFYLVAVPVPTPKVEFAPGFSAPIIERPYKVYDTDTPLQHAAEYMRISHTVSLKQRAMNYYTSALPYVVFGWFIGVLALSIWHVGGFIHLLRLKRQKVRLVDEFLKERLLSLAERLKVTRPVILMESALVQIPTVVGWLRPVILLPASALTGLSPEQLEALLAHELAHIRRYDYLVNMFQTLVEILGFYHPAVWWISYTIRVEREDCCDDLAVSVCGDKVVYARALTSMEETRLSQGELAVAATGGNLSRRIRRLIGTGSGKNIRFGYVPVVISILLIVALMIPTTLALTAKRGDKASSSVDTEESDSIKALDSYTVATDQINDSERYPVADLDETDVKGQILFDCEIYEVPVDVKFLKGKQNEDEVGQMIWLGKEYANRLETLFKKTQKAKKLTAPRVLVLEGEEASMIVGSDIPYNEGYESTTETEPKPIIKTAFEGIELKIKGQVIDSNAIHTEFQLTQSQTSLKTHKDDKGREIQIPVVASSTCATDVVIPGNTPVVIGGLKSQSNDNSQLLLVIIPTIMHPVKGIERKVGANQRLLEQDETILQYKALEEQAVELQQKLYEIQTKLAELETTKAELSELNKLSSDRTRPKEAKTEHERLAAMADRFAERGDFARAIEHLEEAIELARVEKDYGIGIAINKVDGLIRISQLLPDAPASGSSFRQGDFIKAIDGVSTEGMSLNEVVARIRGPKGTKVTLTVKCHSQDITMEETFTRQLPMKGSPVLQEYYWRLDAYEAGKTWPQYCEMMENYKPLPEEAVRIYELKYANPEELAQLLKRILERRSKGVGEKPTEIVKILPDLGHKKLIILASPAEIQLIEALIAELDVLAKRDTAVLKADPYTEYKHELAADSIITQVIKLKYADCESVEQILRQILSDEHLKIAADERTNMLIVAGTKSAIEEIKALVAEIDVPVPDKNLEVGEPEKQGGENF